MVRKEKSSTLQTPHPLLPLKPAGETEIRAATAVRGHWRIENRNYQKREASLCQGDRHRHRKPNAALTFALKRNALLAIIPFKEGLPLARFFDLHRRSPAVDLHLILNLPPQL